ncbi:MAG TPA: hypothetical protein VF316_21310 [Polyangiaceae bacterium]
MRRIVVATHGHCFDGLCSAVLFTKFYRHLHPGEELSFQYLGSGYGPGQNGVDPKVLDGDDNVILDFRFSPSPKLTWYFDHHVSAFPTPGDLAVYEESIGAKPEAERRMFHDGTYSSCTKLIADVGKRSFGLDVAPLENLVHWADIIDAARFPSADMAVARDEAALQLMTVIEHHGDDAMLTKMVPRLLEQPLDVVARSEDVQQAYAPLRDGQQGFIDLVKSHAVTRGNAVLVDLSDKEIEVAAKFVTYALYPQSAYSVLLTRSPKKCKISIGFNPWCGKTRTHDIAKICERHGGGGHPVVGAISLGGGDLVKAQELANAITDELSVP